MLYLRAYQREGESYALIKSFVQSQGLVFSGCCHDIYLSDPRRIPPEKLSEIIHH